MAAVLDLSTSLVKLSALPMALQNSLDAAGSPLEEEEMETWHYPTILQSIHIAARFSKWAVVTR